MRDFRRPESPRKREEEQQYYSPFTKLIVLALLTILSTVLIYTPSRVDRRSSLLDSITCDGGDRLCLDPYDQSCNSNTEGKKVVRLATFFV